jgi:nanoRNase/pAp phosphatase (c-di-AMP/oligoRNAs hydrolase)
VKTKQLLKKYPKIANIPLEYTVAIHNGACPTTTMVGNYLLKHIKCDFVVVYSYHLEKHKYTISFRSKTINVESIAKILGGGGHKYAASCQISSSEFRLEDLFEVNN